MIKKLFIWVILLFLIYNGFISIFPLHSKTSYSNFERAEDFVFGTNKYDTILVGSSLVGGFGNNKIFRGEKFFKLYFPYSGSCSGTEIIVQSGRIPKVLYVELNHIDRGIDTSLIHSTFDNHLIKSYFPSFRRKNMFFNYVIEKLKPTKDDISNANKPSKILFQTLLNKKKEEFSILPDSIRFLHNLKVLKKNLEYLSKNGCKIILFEMPFEHELNNLKYTSFVRKMTAENFKNNNFVIIPLDTSVHYNTGDGVHLLWADCDKYEIYLAKCLGL